MFNILKKKDKRERTTIKLYSGDVNGKCVIVNLDRNFEERKKLYNELRKLAKDGSFNAYYKEMRFYYFAKEA